MEDLPCNICIEAMTAAAGHVSSGQQKGGRAGGREGGKAFGGHRASLSTQFTFRTLCFSLQMAQENLLDDFLSWITWNMLQLKHLTTMYSGMPPNLPSPAPFKKNSFEVRVCTKPKSLISAVPTGGNGDGDAAQF